MSHRRPVCHIVRDVHERPVWRHECRVPKWIHWILVAVPTSRTLHVLQDGAVWRSHPLDLSETDQWEAICSEHVISFELLETRLADSCHQRRIYDVINHHSPCRRSCFRDRTKRMLRCVFARSFRERKLEFLSAQHVKLGFQVVLRYPVLFAQNYQNTNKRNFGALPRAHFHGSTTRGTLQSSRPDRRGARRQGRATAAG